VAVRSARIASGAAASGTTTTLVTCPAGKTYIVKDIRVSHTSTGNTQYILATASGPGSVWLDHGTLTAPVVKSYQGFIVLEPGNQLVIFSSAAAIDYWVSGAELDGTAP